MEHVFFDEYSTNIGSERRIIWKNKNWGRNWGVGREGLQVDRTLLNIVHEQIGEKISDSKFVAIFPTRLYFAPDYRLFVFKINIMV